MQALDTLSENADALGPFLDTLLSNNREAFYRIQKVITDIFPEFKFVNPHKSQNGVSLTLTLAKTGEEIPLTHCGTGVEQILALATFVVTAEPGTLVLLDEPHSYLHPTAERKVTDFLLAHSELRYVIATHSAILINSVHPDRILLLGDSDIVDRTPKPANSDSLPSLIHSLGYKNSDLLFNDRLILVEGESDQEILPLLLAQSPTIGSTALGRTGFPVMNGEGKLRGRQQQTSILYWEEFLSELGKNQMPRVYLFDGGCVQEDRSLLQKSKIFERDSGAYLKFLKMHEIENYLLTADAILATLSELANFQGQTSPDINLERVSKSLQAILDGRITKSSTPMDRNKIVSVM